MTLYNCIACAKRNAPKFNMEETTGVLSKLVRFVYSEKLFSGRQHDLSSPSHPSAVAAAAAAAAALSHRSGFLSHFYATNDARSPFHRNSSGND